MCSCIVIQGLGITVLCDMRLYNSHNDWVCANIEIDAVVIRVAT